MIRTLTPALAAATLLCAAFSGPLAAADAKAPADISKPVTTPRVGGSPADAQFRAAQQESGKGYQAARATCRAKPSAERTGCVTAAKTELKQAQAEAEATHDAAKKAR